LLLTASCAHLPAASPDVPAPAPSFEVSAGQDSEPAPEPVEQGRAEDTGVAESVDEVDPSDPTKIDARVGVGYKGTDFIGGTTMSEVRTKVALQLGHQSTFVMDIGVGRLSGYPQDDDVGLTDGRFRYFRLGEVDRRARGYQGWGGSVEVQTQGNVPGTDGSNLLALGGLGAFGWGKEVSLYANLILSGAWSRNLDDYLGSAVRGDLIFAYRPQGLWNGSYLKLKPSYSYGITDALEGEASFDVETSLGGAFSEAKLWWWEIQVRTFLQEDLIEDSSGSESGLAPDWSLFLSITHFF